MYPLSSRYSWRLAGLVVGFFAVAQSGSAQGSHSTTTDVHSAPPSSEHPATLIGAVVDSIHMGPLVGATVLVNGTTLSTQTDDHGKFRIDSIPPGSYRIAVFHPLLDTLGVSIGTMPLSLGPDSVRELVLATPSALSVVSSVCPVAKRRLGPGAILGHISDPDTHAPLDSVRVSLAWMEVQASKETGVRRTASIREGISDASGAFAICGIPAGVQGTIRADRGRAQTAEVPVALDESPLLIQSLTMSLVAGTTDSAAATGQAVLTGRVTDPKGLPVVGAQVSVQGAHASVTSATDGTFRLAGLPSGTRDVLIRRVGFTATQVPVELSKTAPVNIVVHLDEAARTLATVHVDAPIDSALKSDGFTDRRRIGMGYYLGPEDIARQMPPQISSLFQMIPGFQVSPGMGMGMRIKSIRDGCITYWIDGVPWPESQPGELDSQYKPEQLMAIETYSAAGAPPQFEAPGRSSCSVVVIWTNRTVRH